MSLSLTCFDSFITGIFTDLGGNASGIEKVVQGLNNSISAYNNYALSVTLSDIVTDLATCVKDSLASSLSETSSVIKRAAIFLSAVILIAAVFIALAVKYLDTEWILITFFVLLVVVAFLFFFLSQIVDAAVSDIVSRAETKVEACISKAESDVQTLKTEEGTRISKALCAY